ncbi:pre-peptidase C-terminal domain-containing protein [[Eubacterium] cellulosolvens]
MRISKGKYRNRILKNKIIPIIVCIMIIISGVNLVLLSATNHGPSLVQAETPPTNTRGPRQPNTQHEPSNNNIDTADTVTYNTGGQFIDADIGSGDPCDYWKIPIDYGTKRFNAKNELIGADNSKEIIVRLDNQNINGGVIMTWYDADKHELGVSIVTMVTGSQGNFSIVGQVNSEIYVKVSPASSGTGNYRLSIYNTTYSYNPSWDDRNRFTTATNRNITKGFSITEYLDFKFDNADFYTFDAVSNQKIKIEMTPATGCDFDIYLFDSQVPTAWVASSKNMAKGVVGKESIVYPAQSAKTYYLRVVVRIDGTWNGWRGNYTLVVSGNVPPYWNNSFTTSYEMDEDSDPLTIIIENAFYDINTGDEITHQIKDPTVGSGVWRNEPIIFTLDTATIEFKEDLEILKVILIITPLENKFGRENLTVRATDLEKDFYREKNLTVNIRPVNDLPILNNTKQWENGVVVLPNADGTKLTGKEGEPFNTRVTAWDPVDPWDVITFFDNTDLFEIEPTTGIISFIPTYHVTGTHKVEITARDNGTAPNETTREFEFIIKRGTNYPVVILYEPGPNSVQYTLRPEFRWEQTNEDFFDKNINYDFYLSTEKNWVTNRDPRALNTTLNNTFYKQPTNLEDNTTYYWTVIPNDGIHLGDCESGVSSFSTNLYIEKPYVNLKTPNHNQMLDTKNVVLSWELDYSGSEAVQYDLYFEVSMEDMLDRNRTPYKEKLTTTSMEIKGLYLDKYYYWQVIPYTAKVRLSADESEIRSFYIASKIPRIEMLSPANRTLQYDNWVTLSWAVNYTKPEDVVCELHYGTLAPLTVNIMNFTDTFTYSLYDLKDTTYYWKLVPFLGSDLRGRESELRIFTIQHVPNMLHTELLEPVNITLYSQFVSLSWKTVLNEGVDISKVWYEIYVDNVTSDPSKMELKATKYRNINYLLDLPREPKKTYYWYVVPHADTVDGHFKGYCASGVVYFIFDYASPVYDFNLQMEETYLRVDPGTSKYFHFNLINKGNRETSISISISSNAAGNINFTLATKKVTLLLSGTERINVTFLALPTAVKGNYTATITAISAEDVNKTKTGTITIEVSGKDEDGKENGKGDGDETDYSLAIGISAIVVIIIIVLLVGLLLMRKRKTRAAEAEATAAAQTGRTAGPPTQTAGQIQPVTPVQPVAPLAHTTPAPPVRAVQPVQPVRPVSPVKPVSPIQPVRPVSPVKPVQPPPAASAPAPAAPVARPPVKPV